MRSHLWLILSSCFTPGTDAWGWDSKGYFQCKWATLSGLGLSLSRGDYSFTTQLWDALLLWKSLMSDSWRVLDDSRLAQDGLRMGSWRAHDELMMGLRWAHDGLMMGSWWAQDGLRMGSWRAHDGLMMGLRWAHDGLMMGSWWAQDGLMMGSCRAHDGLMMGSWWAHNGLMIGSWWAHAYLLLFTFGHIWRLKVDN